MALRLRSDLTLSDLTRPLPSQQSLRPSGIEGGLLERVLILGSLELIELSGHKLSCNALLLELLVVFFLCQLLHLILDILGIACILEDLSPCLVLSLLAEQIHFA